MQQSLEQLENSVWPESAQASPEMVQCMALRKKPLASLSATDLALLIEQKMGLTYVVPLALERLQSDPLLEANYFRGGLVSAVLSLPSAYWQEAPKQVAMLKEIKYELELIHESIEEDLLPKFAGL